MELSAEQYLKQLQHIDVAINQELERLSEMKADASCMGAVDYSKDRVQAEPVNLLEKKVCSYADYESMINRHIDSFIDAKERIIAEIRGLHRSRYTEMLFKKYVQYKNLERVAHEMGISYRYAVELHRKALDAFEETYKNLQYIT